MGDFLAIDTGDWAPLDISELRGEAIANVFTSKALKIMAVMSLFCVATTSKGPAK